jgi:hypothetical protein
LISLLVGKLEKVLHPFKVTVTPPALAITSGNTRVWLARMIVGDGGCIRTLNDHARLDAVSVGRSRLLLQRRRDQNVAVRVRSIVGYHFGLRKPPTLPAAFTCLSKLGHVRTASR